MLLRPKAYIELFENLLLDYKDVNDQLRDGLADDNMNGTSQWRTFHVWYRNVPSLEAAPLVPRLQTLRPFDSDLNSAIG